MWLLVVLLVVSVIATVVARRRGREARDSVDAQQRQLEALRIAAAAAQAPTGERATSPVPVRSLPAARGRSPRASRTWMYLGGGLLAVAAVAALVLTVGQNDSSGGSGDNRQAGEKHPSTSTSTSTSTTTTTVAPALTVGPLTRGTVTVSMPAGAYTVTVAARGACWMEAQAADKTVLLTTTLQSGDSKAIPGSGPMTLRLGNPGMVDVQVNAEALMLPASGGAAMNVQLNPAA